MEPAAGLAYRTLEGPEEQQCGNYQWKIDWELDSPAVAGGWIVQYITEVFDIETCGGKTLTIDEALEYCSGAKIDFSSRIPFWEAWRVDAGQTKTGDDSQEDDLFGLFEFQNTRGSFGLYAEANFYDGWNAPAAWDTTYKLPYGALPRTQSHPAFPAAVGAPVVRKFGGAWDCCEDQDPKTLLASTDETTQGEIESVRKFARELEL